MSYILNNKKEEIKKKKIKKRKRNELMKGYNIL